MTDTVIIGKSQLCKKAYSVTIRQRKINSKGKVTVNSLNSTSFQIKDIGGKSSLMMLKQKVMKALEK